MKAKKWLGLVAAMTVAVMGFSGVASAKTFISIATGGTAGTYYPIGGAIAQAVSKGSDIQATAETSNASVANINLLAKGDIEVAMVQNDITFWALNGKMMFKTPVKNIRAIAALYPEHVQLVTTKASGIKTIADLKGKRVSVGAPGSGVEGDVRSIFQVVGLRYQDMRVDFLDYGGTASRFKDNQIDAGFWVTGYPTASIMDLATMKDITLIPFDDDLIKKIRKEFPFFIASKIPAGTYRGVDRDVSTIAVKAILVTHDKVPDEVIYKFTKAMFANIKDIQGAHAAARQINLKTALDGLTAPLHPGAAKFYKEKGMKVQ